LLCGWSPPVGWVELLAPAPEPDAAVPTTWLPPEADVAWTCTCWWEASSAVVSLWVASPPRVPRLIGARE
jgi:hypothetical protein